ncbi:hypothetical protein [Scytonema hofmannii]|nr:hypothetical protein [Scytonema hofmannii]
MSRITPEFRQAREMNRYLQEQADRYAQISLSSFDTTTAKCFWRSL